MFNLKISVIGLGYIGLPTAAIFASKGFEVIGVDLNPNVVKTVNRGEIHFIEPSLDKIVKTAVDAGCLKASTVLKPAEAFIIAVPTPFKRSHEPDLSFIESAVHSIASVLEKGNLVILESTVPVGTTEKIVDWMRAIRPDLTFPVFGEEFESSNIAVAHCPERVLPGNIVRELVENDRIIGGMTTRCAMRAHDIYKAFVTGVCMETDCRTAELGKLVENSFRDVNIAFANELSLICDKLKIDVWKLIELANRHPRVNILQPGPGVGGHCIAVDPWFIVDSAPLESRLIRTARIVNDSKPEFVIDKVKQRTQMLSKKTSELTIACLGLSFKPDIDDLRESPALNIAKIIGSMGFFKNLIVEPNIDVLPMDFDKIGNELCDVDRAIEEANIIVLLVDHKSFKKININKLLGKEVIDTKGILNAP